MGRPCRGRPPRAAEHGGERHVQSHADRHRCIRRSAADDIPAHLRHARTAIPRHHRRHRAASLAHIDVSSIEANIEHTRFPVPEGKDYANPADYPGLVRAADLVGQLADINYLRKLPALFAEFSETGVNERLGYRSVADLRAAYCGFFWQVVKPYIGDALRYLRVTQEGKQWIASLYAHAFSEEHGGALMD